MALLYKKLRLGTLRTNCYLVWEEKSKKCLVIDAADEGVAVSDEIEILGLAPIMILATHGHFDHMLGVLDLKLIYKIPLAISKKDEFLLKRQKQTAAYFLRRKMETPNLVKVDINLDREKEIFLGEEKIEIIKTPGHTPGGLCFYYAKTGWLFSGDTWFDGAVGRTDFSYGSAKDLQNSLARLKLLPVGTRFFPGHGRDFVLKKE